MLCWMNGNYIEEQQLTISPFDHGFLYGLGFFETLRTYQGKVVLFQEHYNRLCMALARYRIKVPYTISEIQEVISELTKRSGGEDGVFRINVSAGNYGLELQTGYNNPNVIIFRRPLNQRKRGLEKVASWLQTPRNLPEQEVRYKSHHFGNIALARFEINNLEECEGFFVTRRGIVAEGIQSNIFWVKDDILYTPSLATGIIPGVTRDWLIMTAKERGIIVVEDMFIKSELEEAYECFVTNSIEEIVPISAIGNHNFLGKDGPLFQLLQQAYIEEIIQTIKRSTF